MLKIGLTGNELKIGLAKNGLKIDMARKELKIDMAVNELKIDMTKNELKIDMAGNELKIQLSKSSRSKNGGAYFSAVCGSNLVPVSATEGHEHWACDRLLGFFSRAHFFCFPKFAVLKAAFQQYLYQNDQHGFLMGPTFRFLSTTPVWWPFCQ